MVVLLLAPKWVLWHLWSCKTHIVLLMDTLPNCKPLGKPSISLPVLAWLMSLAGRLWWVTSILKISMLCLEMLEGLGAWIFILIVMMVMMGDGGPLVVLLGDRVVVVSSWWLELCTVGLPSLHILSSIAYLVEVRSIGLRCQLDVPVIISLSWGPNLHVCTTSWTLDIGAKWTALLLWVM